MRVVLQRVKYAKVIIDGRIHAAIEHGVLLLLGIEQGDDETDAVWLSGKVCNLRIFADNEGNMNLNIKQVDGEILIVSQFTLHASTKKGNRPSFIKAARPDYANPLYEKFISQASFELGKNCKTGQFGADMQIELLNDGPVTILLDSKQKE